MPKLLSYAHAVARKSQPTAPGPGPRANPAELWILRHKVGGSRYTAAQQVTYVARLLGYGEGKIDDWRACPWHALKYEDVEHVRALLVERIARGEQMPSSANNMLVSFKGVMNEVWRLGVGRDEAWLTAEELEAIRQVERLPGKRLKKPRRTLTEDELARLIAHCGADDSARGVRDRLIFGLAAVCGMRASEYAALTLADYDRDGKRLRIPQIKVEVSDEDVWHPLEEPVLGYMEAWLAVRGLQPGALLTRLERGGMGVLTHLKPDSITTIMARRGEEIGLDHVSGHAARRSYVTRVLKYTGDLAMAAKLARHKSPTTTATYYDQRDLDDKRETMRRVPFPATKDEPTSS